MRLPKYPAKPHPTGQARVQFRGKQIYLGLFGSPASHEKFAKLLEGITSATPTQPAPVKKSYMLSEVMEPYLDFAKEYYCETNYDHLQRLCLGVLAETHAFTPLESFGPLALEAVRDQMIGKGWSRRYINDQIDRIRRMMKWAVARQMCPAEVHRSLMAVASLRKGRSAAPERPRVMPADDALIAAVLPFLRPVVRVMVQFQRLTGVRSAELCAMQLEHIDRTEPIWIYRPPKHKTTHLDKELAYAIGPKAQEVIRPLLETKPFIFSPRENVLLLNAERRNGKPPIKKGPGVRRSIGDQYTSKTYYKAIAVSIRRAREVALKADPELKEFGKFFPHQLRHSKSTEVRAKYDIESARVALGHSHISAAEVYAEADLALARQIALETG